MILEARAPARGGLSLALIFGERGWTVDGRSRLQAGARGTSFSCQNRNPGTKSRINHPTDVNNQRRFRLRRPFHVGALGFLSSGLLSLQAATLWTGPNINFTQSTSTESDVVVAGKVVLTRGGNDGLFNTAAGEVYPPGPSSPADTEWAFGTLGNFSSLTYQSLESMRNGDLALVILNKQMVVHLIREDIYLAVMFTAWGQHGAGGFAYTRSTAAVAVHPTVTVTSPANGATFAAPATVELTSAATVTGGVVTNVQYFAGTTVLGHATSAPFTLSASLPTPGSYPLTAVATAAGVSSTSSVVNITVVGPTAVSLGSPAVNGGSFSFSYSADPGLTYVIERSSNLVDWLPISTNTPSSSPALFSDSLVSDASRYYRVGRLPNP